MGESTSVVYDVEIHFKIVSSHGILVLGLVNR